MSSTDPSFRMTIVDVFGIKGRGTIATGRIERGSVRVGDEVFIKGPNSSGVAVVTGIESFKEHRNQAQAGESVGILLRGHTQVPIDRGYVLLGSDSEIGQTPLSDSLHGDTLPKQSSADKQKPSRLKTYHNERLGFEMDVPREWPLPQKVDANALVFYCAPIEVFNLVIQFLLPERLLEYTEFEFRVYAQVQSHTDLSFGRIYVGDKNHVWARYKMESGIWAKKYMIVFGNVEYAITASCNNKQTFTEREEIWDAVVRSFRLTKWAEEDVAFIKTQRKMLAGELFEKAYEASEEGHYLEACSLLEECLRDNPNHILAHKELAFLLKNMGDVKEALRHRLEVKRLDPSDQVNRFNLAELYFLLEAHDDALREIDELLAIEPSNWRFLELERIITGRPLTYLKHYEEEAQQQPGEKRNLRLVDSIIPDFPYATYLFLLYQWEENLSDEEARRLAHRAAAFICCAIYDVAIRAELLCQPSPKPHGRRPAWILEGEKMPASLILLDIDASERMCRMTIGATVIYRGEPPSDRTRWEKLCKVFKTQFNSICV